MPLTTRCRHCGRLFPVYAQQLKKRRGKVKCPQCGGKFDAVTALLDEVVLAEETKTAARAGKPRGRVAATAPASLLTFDEPGKGVRRLRILLWVLGVLLLTAGLILQAGWWERARWLSQPRVRAALEQVCERLDCRLPSPRLPGTIEILQPVFTDHPEDQRALRLSLTLINRAAVAQSPPLLQLELYDSQGDLIAVRRFSPGQYLTAESAPERLAPGRAVNVLLDLATPQASPAGFRLELF